MEYFEKSESFLGILVFGYPYCSSSNSTEFSTEDEGKFPFPFHIGASIPTIRDMFLDVIVRKKNSIIFCIKFIMYMYIKKKKNDRGSHFMDQIFTGELSRKDSVGVLR